MLLRQTNYLEYPPAHNTHTFYHSQFQSVFLYGVCDSHRTRLGVNDYAETHVNVAQNQRRVSIAVCEGLRPSARYKL